MSVQSRIFHGLTAPYYRHNRRQIPLRLLRALWPRRSAMQTVTLPWRVRLQLNANEFVGNSIWTTGVHDLAVSEAIWRVLDPGNVAVDVGANIGYMTSIMSVRVGHSGRVFAFEPQPDVFRTLAGNARMFAQQPELGEVTAFNIALGDRNGRAVLVSDEGWEANQGTARVAEATGNANEGRPVTETVRAPTEIAIDMLRLDDAIGNRGVALLKIDVEGHEKEVLVGAERLLANRLIDTVIYEDHVGEDSETHAILRAAGFTVWILDRNDEGVFLAVTSAVRNCQEAPNFIASREPDEVERRFSTRGWKLFER
jgi:FkbM family methyltransferase